MSEFYQKYMTLDSADIKVFRKFLESAIDVIASVALYIAIAVAVALVVWAVVVRNKDDEYLKGVRKTMLGIVIGFAVGVISILGSFKILAEYMAGHFTWHSWLIAGLFVLIIAGIIATTVLHKQGKAAYKWVGLGFAVAALIYLVVILCVVPATDDYYNPGIPTFDAASGYYTVTGGAWLMYVLSAVLVAAIVVLALIGSRESEYNAKSLTYAAICIALSFALSYIKFFSMPQGGSVTFASLLPLALYSYMFGTRKGVIAGVVYGLLQFVQSPQYYQSMQVLLDYPIAFAAIGLAGIGRSMKFLKGNVYAEFTIGTTIAVLFRYIAHIMSGYFVFYTYADTQNPLVYSIVYNSYTLVDLLIVLVVGVIALTSKNLRRTILTANTTEAAQ